MLKYASSLLDAIAQGPVMTFLFAGSSYVKGYKSGIVNTNKCGNGYRGNLGTTAVGYGVDGDTTYYIVKNNWGTTWGEEGYIRLAADFGSTFNRAQPGTCGIQNYGVYPIV